MKTFAQYLLCCLLIIISTSIIVYAQDPLTIDKDGNVNINNATIGHMKSESYSHGYNWAGFKHKDVKSGDLGYGLLHEFNGARTLINIKKIAEGSNYIGFRVDNDNKMVMNNKGYLGIGTNNPLKPLHVNGEGYFEDDVGFAKKVNIKGDATINNAAIGHMKSESHSHGNDWAGFKHKDVKSGDLGYALLQEYDGARTLINIKKQTSGANYIGFRVDNEDKMVVLGNGNVGIGIEGPKTGFHVNVNSYFDKEVGFDEKTFFNGNVGIGIKQPETGFHVNVNTLFDKNVSFDGSVGIGTRSPERGKLQVSGSVDYKYRKWNKKDKVSGYFSYWIICGNLWEASDARTKTIIGTSDRQTDLKTLQNIAITDYQMKDTIAFGQEKIKKVIAQQVKEVFPQAVTSTTKEIPDIYQVASLHDGWVNLDTDVKVGDRILLIFGHKQEIFEVLNVRERGFEVDTDREGEVFVYGREVDDFHLVDYDAISILNVSATQELTKQVEDLKAQNKRQEERITSMETQLQEMEKLSATVEALKKLLPENQPEKTLVSTIASEK